MKKYLISMLLLATTSFPTWADKDMPIQFDQLPSNAQAFITQHYNSANISFAKVDVDIFEKSYDVVFTDGVKIEFDHKGVWDEISCPRSQKLSDKLFPQEILEVINKNYSKWNIIGFERKRFGWEITLNNGLELFFNKEYHLVGIDD